MTDVGRLLSLTAGINAALNSIGTAPGAFTTLLPRGTVPSLLPRSREPLDRKLAAVDGRRFPRAQGRKNVDPINLPLEMKGINANTGAAVADWEAKQEAGMLWPALFGAAAAATVGAKPTVAAAGSSTAALETGADTLAALEIFGVTTSVGFEIRQVIAGGGTTTITPNAAFKGVPVALGDIIRFGRYTHAPALTDHKHVWLNAEWENARRRYSDCAPASFMLTIPNSGFVDLDVVLNPNDYADVAEANPAFAAPTAGSPIVSGGCQFIVAAKQLMIRNAKLTVDNGVAMRETSTGANGIAGGVCADKTNVMLEGECYVGNDNPTIGELVDDSGTPSLDNILGSDAVIGEVATVRDIMLQVGGAAGAAMFIRIPEADLRGEVVEGGAFNVLKFQAFATGAVPLYFGVG